jgi:hypothetical protein
MAVVDDFVVLLGWGGPGKEWLIHDPAKGSSAKKFAKQWKQLENWTFLAVTRIPVWEIAL